MSEKYHQNSNNGSNENSLAFYNYLFEASGLASIYCETDSTIVLINKNAAEYLGISAQDAKGKKYLDLIPAEFVENSTHFFLEVNNKKEPIVYESKLYVNGRYRWFNSLFQPILNSAQKLIGIYIHSREFTDLKEKEIELQNSEMMFRKIFNQAASGIAIIDKSGIITKVNPMFCDIFGYSQDELINQNFNRITGYTDTTANSNLLEIIQSSPLDSHNFERKYTHKTGRVIWMNLHLSVIRDEEGRFNFSIVLINDITEKKQSYFEVLESEEKYRHLFENMTDACLICEPVINENNRLIDFIFKDSNPSLDALAGINLDKFKGQNASELFRVIKPELLNYLESVIINGSTNTLDIKDDFLNKYLTIKAFRFYKNQFAIVLIDNTVQILVQHEIARQKQLLETTFNSINDGIVITDTEHNIKIANKGVMTTFGYEADEILGKSAEIFYLNQDDFINAVKVNLNPELKDQSPYKQLYCKKDGTEFVGETYGTPLFSETGEYLGNFGLTRDITLREKLLNELIMAREKAEESDRLKSAFLANMSHEIRTPMNGILGFAELLNRKELPEISRQRYIDIINESSKQLLGIVNDIIDISKIETGQIDVFSTEINLDEFIFEIYSFFKPIASKKGIELLLEKTKPEIQSLFISDSVKLRQILNNLISNAIKFTLQGSVTIFYQLTDERVDFYIRDTGIGISKKDYLRIFDRFSQLEQPEKIKYSGTGLGLSITKAFIDRLGGEIWIDSEVKKGSSFHFFLPMVFIDKSIESTEFNFPQPIYQSTILLVDNVEVNFLYLREILVARSFKVSRALPNQNLLSILTSQPEIKLVIINIQLNAQNEYHIISRVKAQLPEIKIIAQLSYALSNDKDKVMEAGCDDILIKPITVPKLLSSIHKCLVVKG